ncbi:hypothetical protein LG307_21380 [Sutcliffiella horikoshii]|uniref:hypothetical protein n=1 Tax=Sutcliffiella horikoshii TaxID=79883 RepID=UPI00384E3A74
MTLLIVSIFLLTACSSVEKVQHIEVFVAETSEQDDEGFFITTGYKKVNSITSIEEGKHHIKTDIKSIEDFYDKEGNYLRTEIIHSTFNKTYVTQKEDAVNLKEEIKKPSTILIPDENIELFKLENKTKGEEEKVKEHVLSFMDML